MSVHQECYGIKKLPDEDWVCELCREYKGLGKLLRCPLCPCRGGVLRKTMTPTVKSFFNGKNDEYADYFRRKLSHQKSSKSIKSSNMKPLEGTPSNAAHDTGLTDSKELRDDLLVNPPPIASFWIDDDDTFAMARKSEFDTWTTPVATQKPPEVVKPVVPVISQQELAKKEAKEAKDSIKLKKKILKMKRQRNLLNNKNSQILDFPDMHILESYYDYQLLDFKFTDEELEKEPVPPTMWIHMSCMYWVPEVYFNNSQFPVDARNLKGIDKERFKEECSVCLKKAGACVKCSAEGCDITFHVECARRAKVHLEMVTEYQTKFNIHCAAHTPRLLSNLMVSNGKRTQEEVVKYFKYLQRVFRSQDISLATVATTDSIGNGFVETQSEINFSLDNSEDESEDNPKIPRQKIEVSQVARFLSDKNRAILARVRKHVLQRPQYQFTVCLKRIPENPSEFEFMCVSEPLKQLYKNFVHKRDRLWLEMRRKNDDGMPLLHDRFKYLVTLLKSVKRKAGEYFKRNDKGGLVLVKSIEGDGGVVREEGVTGNVTGNGKDQSEVRCEKCLRSWDSSVSVGKLISMRYL